MLLPDVAREDHPENPSLEDEVYRLAMEDEGWGVLSLLPNPPERAAYLIY